MARGTVTHRRAMVLFGKCLFPCVTPPFLTWSNSVPWSADGPSSPADSRDGYNFVLQANLGACPDGCLRPVGLAFDSGGRLCAA